MSKHYVLTNHYREGLLAATRLRFIDWVGNARFGGSFAVQLLDTRAQWETTSKRIGLHPEHLVTKLGLYSQPLDWIFGAQLHFTTLLKRT